jgi:hypothetical protein
MCLQAKQVLRQQTLEPLLSTRQRLPQKLYCRNTLRLLSPPSNARNPALSPLAFYPLLSLALGCYLARNISKSTSHNCLARNRQRSPGSLPTPL